ncbi:MAG: CHRD domain-containing protein [Ignavibacteria bacterium]
MKHLSTLSKIFLAVLCLFIFQKSSFATLYSINNVLSGLQETPPLPTGGSGTILGTYNDVTKKITFTITFSTSGNTTAGHFHGPAPAGVAAGVQIGFTTIPLGVSSGTFTETTPALTPTQETQFLSGLWYANIHTNVFGGGAIRGQLSPVAIKTLDLTFLIEGFYNDVSNIMVGDTVTVNIRNSTTPFAIIEGAKGFLNSSGQTSINYTLPANDTPYYLQVMHRNSIQTWSGLTPSFTANALSYDFTSSNTQAFGNNLRLKGTRYCGFSADVNQDGFVNLNDIILTSNNAINFVNGYVVSDVNGDNLTNLNDIIIAFNNSIGFVKAIVPAP